MGAGAPEGNTNAASGTEWRETIRRVMLKYEKGDVKRRNAMDKVAEALIEKALGGDMQAIKELGDRYDGKPAQSLTVGTPDGKPLFPTDFNVNVIHPEKS